MSLLVVGGMGYVEAYPGQRFRGTPNPQQEMMLDQKQQQKFSMMQRRLAQIEQNHSQYNMSLRRELGNLKRDLGQYQQMEMQEEQWDAMDDQQLGGYQGDPRNELDYSDPRMQQGMHDSGRFGGSQWNDEYGPHNQRGMRRGMNHFGSNRGMHGQQNPYDDVFN